LRTTTFFRRPERVIERGVKKLRKGLDAAGGGDRLAHMPIMIILDIMMGWGGVEWKLRGKKKKVH